MLPPALPCPPRLPAFLLLPSARPALTPALPSQCQIIDYASIDPEPQKFHATTLKLLGVAAACALFTGVRGGLFTICMTRLNVRIRTQLFGALMKQVW